MTTKRGGGQAQGIQIPENVSEFYINSINIAFTPWDFMFLFGTLELPSAIGVGRNRLVQGSIRIDAIVRMSPQVAKATLRALQSVINDFETASGEISIPAEGVANANT